MRKTKAKFSGAPRPDRSLRLRSALNLLFHIREGFPKGKPQVSLWERSDASPAFVSIVAGRRPKKQFLTFWGRSPNVLVASLA